MSGERTRTHVDAHLPLLQPLLLLQLRPALPSLLLLQRVTPASVCVSVLDRRDVLEKEWTHTGS